MLIKYIKYFNSLIYKRSDNFDGDKILWEAPNKDQQVFFILKLGNTVNLGNVSSDDITSLETLRRGLRGDTVGKI